MAERFKFRKRTTVPGIARELLRWSEDKRRVTQFAMARDADGTKVDTDDTHAMCWCVSGAATEIIDIRRAPYARFDRFRDAFEAAAGDSMEHVNDGPGGFRAVRRILRKLAKPARRKAA